MMSVLLGIFKILGIVLLCILGLILILLSAVLFIPIRYEGKGKFTDEEKQGEIKLTWFFKIFRCKCTYSYPKEFKLILKVFWVDVLEKLKKRQERKDRKRKKKEAKEESKRQKTLSKEMKKQKLTENSSNEEYTGQNESEEIQSDTSMDEPSEKGEDSSASQKDALKETLIEKKDKIVFKINKLCDKIKEIKDNIDYYLGVLREKNTQELLKDSKKLLLKIWKNVKPKEYNADLEYGFESPETTGKVYGYYCMTALETGELVNVVPNFEQKVLRGNVYLKGKITVFILLVNGIKIVLDKRLKPLIKQLKHGGK